jgi:hypothetical protein
MGVEEENSLLILEFHIRTVQHLYEENEENQEISENNPSLSPNLKPTSLEYEG